MPLIRVLLTALSPFRRDVVRRIVDAEPDMTLVDEFIGEEEVLAGRASDLADVVIVGTDRERLPVLCGALLYSLPGCKVLAMEDRDGDAVLYEMRPHKVTLGNVSPTELADAIRGATRPELP